MRATFPHRLLPWLLVAPQLAISLVFFYWPALQALRQSMLREDPFGLGDRFVGLANFRRVLGDPAYLNSVRVTVVFSLLTVFFSMAIALLLAVQAEKIVRGKGFYRTLMIWPYAVAAAIAGMLWLFLFNPTSAPSPGRCASSASTGTRSSTAPRRWASSSPPPRGSRSATTSSSSSPASRRSRSR